MLRKRIIFTLIYNNGHFMQSRNFRLQKVGDINWLDKHYQFQEISFSIDELIVLNASREIKLTSDFTEVVSKLTHNVFIPVAAGGGIRNMEDAESLFNSGADKIVLNSILIDDPILVEKLIIRYGSQSILASIDYKKIEGENKVYISDGQIQIDLNLIDYIEYVQRLGVGEIYLNSIDKDGTGFGYDFETIDEIKNDINIPLIIAGGAGNENHLLAGLTVPQVNAVATANLFNFVGNSLPNARRKIINEKINIARWN